MNRKFFKQIIQIEVLSEDVPLKWGNLQDIQYAISQGDCSGVVNEISTKELNSKQTAKELIKQGSEPAFFQLTETGKNEED